MASNVRVDCSDRLADAALGVIAGADGEMGLKRRTTEILGSLALLVATSLDAQTTRVSVSSSGAEANAELHAYVQIALSDDGRFVAFETVASNLVAGDTNGVLDVFLHDRTNATTVRLSESASGIQSNGNSHAADVSNDGRFVVFASQASNLVAGDSNGVADIFLLDRVADSLRRVSVGGGGVQGNGSSLDPRVSDDGDVVAFYSSATNLVPGDSNAQTDVFVHVVSTGETTRVSVGPAGFQANGRSLAVRLSDDGRYVAFVSDASNLVTGDTNGVFDVFVHDRVNATTERVSVSSGGVQANLSADAVAISGDGRFVAFASMAGNLVADDSNGVDDVFVRDRATGSTERVSVSSGGNQSDGGRSYYPNISRDGRYVVFHGTGTDLAPGSFPGYHIFMRDRLSQTTRRISTAMNGGNSNGISARAAISADGQVIGFSSTASNLVAGDTNGFDDVFVNQRADDLLFRHGFE